MRDLRSDLAKTNARPSHRQISETKISDASTENGQSILSSRSSIEMQSDRSSVLLGLVIRFVQSFLLLWFSCNSQSKERNAHEKNELAYIVSSFSAVLFFYWSELFICLLRFVSFRFFSNLIAVKKSSNDIGRCLCSAHPSSVLEQKEQ